MTSANTPTEGQIVDSHHHLWDVSRLEYPWMPPGNNILRRNYLPEHLAPVVRRKNVTKTVVVQAQQTMAEAEVLLEWAEATDFVAGVVAWADLTDPNVGAALDEFSRRPKIVGIRHQVHDEPDEAWILREDVVRGLNELASRDLTYDLLLRPQHLKHVPALADRVPGLKMVIDHIGKPLIAEGKMEPWASDIAAVAEIPGMYCKVSGMVTEADLDRWTAAELLPYVAHVIERFGYDRVMFGSDWPVCLLAASYDEVVASTLLAAGDMSAGQRAQLMGLNAIEFYGL